MKTVFVLNPDYYTDDAVMYTEELLNTLCVNHVILGFRRQ